MKMRPKCRIWWPKQLSCCKLPSSTVLFGWFFSDSAASTDIIVAFAHDEASLSRCQFGLQGILHYANGNLPVFLQEKSNLSIVGHCVADFSCNSPLFGVGNEEDQMKSSIHGSVPQLNSPDMVGENCGLQNCRCHRIDALLEQFTQASVQNCNCIQLLRGSHEFVGKKIDWIPKFHHIHWNGQLVTDCDVHVIVYETPVFGAHHFSLGFWNSSEQVRSPLKKPKWVNELHQKQLLFDLDTVILALNSAGAAKYFFDRHVGFKEPFVRFPMVSMFVSFVWKSFILSMSLFSTLVYIILQLLHSFLIYGSEFWIFIILIKVFSNTCKIIQIRCCQILYWPIFLQENGLRSQSCVQYAEKASVRKNSMWSSIAVDVLLGNLIGFALLCHAESASIWILDFSNEITNSLLRSGCVWLMGVPAGFKLNTELAGILGMISLTVIQIWSTLGFFVGFLFIYFIKGLAISGILFGVTTPAAMTMDMIVLATSHISILHWSISILYSHQIQALAALWRLFRGRKWNPLRQRLDSYDYTVEQHIVGSLLFTLLLLLLPTTSVFYIFLAIMNTSFSVICILIEVTISIIHATPYIEIFIWLVRPKRFPSGIWFEILSYQSNNVNLLEIGKSSQLAQPSSGRGYSVLCSFLHSNFLNIGQIIFPHYRPVFAGVSRSFVGSLAYGVLTGKRIPSTLGTVLPSKMPWISIPYREYWHLCHDRCFHEWQTATCFH
ncbi:uncharacterized protein LOC131167786 [Malania oleifera]|uniref:uncharacterized protein LOC131167786 n=1 Tax=Malania oleifera TaxID=397392 RepID=UPI0025ADC22C|nr:uncharacterized protein LOC131167786 [Malania oleifera]XP_057982654.1 uncharacterized protein LOC131167786 [Malania oleifera]